MSRRQYGEDNATKTSRENLRARIVAEAVGFPDEIRMRDVRKIFTVLKPDIPFNSFLDLFQEYTSYLLKGPKLKRTFQYTDPLLLSLSYQIYKKGLNIPPEEGFLIRELPTGDIADYRLLLASMIMSTFLYSLPFTSKRIPTGLVTEELTRRVAEAFPDAPRWHSPRLEGILEKLEKDGFNTLNKHDFQLLNSAEDRAIGLVAWHASWNRSKQDYENVFSPFLRGIGLRDVIEYGKAVVYPSAVEPNPEKYCLYEFSLGDVTRYAERRGIKLEKMTLTHKRLRYLLLHELESDFTPIFFERNPSTFQADFRLLDTNDLGALCYSIAEARSEIIDGAYKGQVFERFILDLLTGKIALELASSEWHGTSFYIIDTRGKPVQKHHVVSYDYEPPKGFTGIRTKRDRKSAAFRPFLEAEGLQELEIDLLLIHENHPEHILIGQCKFPKKYREEEYSEAEKKLSKTAEFIDNSRDARLELKLPLDCKVLSAFFTSYSGPALAGPGPVIKTTLHTTMTGLFKEWISQALRP